MSVKAAPPAQSPKADEMIPVGLATTVAVPVSAILAVWAAIQGIVAGEVTNGVLAAGIPALLIVVTWLVGRFSQAYARFRDAPTASAKADVALAEAALAKAAYDEARAALTTNPGPLPPTIGDPRV